jgi:hypothetical protein
VEVNGNTYIKYVRAAKTTDPVFTDTCISEDQDMTTVYALGQSTAGGTVFHTPKSAVEVLGTSASNQDFYKDDELKYHGGGIGKSGVPSSYAQGRGTLGGSMSVNLFKEDAAPSAGACTPSTLAPEFACQHTRLGGNLIIHYNPAQAGDTAATLALQAPSASGWVAFGFASSTPPMMAGATAVMSVSNAANQQAGVFKINGYSPSDLTEVPSGAALASRRLAQDGSFTVTDVRPRCTITAPLSPCVRWSHLCGCAATEVAHTLRWGMRALGQTECVSGVRVLGNVSR